MRPGLAALALLAAMPAAADTVTGTLTWPEAVALPPGAVLEVTVEDISRVDAPSIRLARFAVAPVGRPPLAVELDVPEPDPRTRLTLRATIRHDGALLLTTDTIAPVLTQGAPAHADLALIPVAAPAAPSLAGIDWHLTLLGGQPLPPEAREALLRFDAGMDGARFAATAGCNRFVGSVRIEADTLAFGPAATTRMACPPPLDAAEAALSAAIAAAARWEIDGPTLRLRDAGGAILLEATSP